MNCNLLLGILLDLLSLTVFKIRDGVQFINIRRSPFRTSVNAKSEVKFSEFCNLLAFGKAKFRLNAG